MAAAAQSPSCLRNPLSLCPVDEDRQGRVGLMAGGRADETPLPRLFFVLVAIITVGGLLLRLPSFHDSLFGDEISTYFIVTGHSLPRVLRLVESNQETSPPLYFMLAWAMKGLLSNPAESIRLVSLITGTAAIPLTFLLGLWTVGRRAAVVGAAFVALSPYMIFYSTEARPFMLMLFLTLLSTLALLRALDSDQNVWWVAYAACSCGAVYSPLHGRVLARRSVCVGLLGPAPSYGSTSSLQMWRPHWASSHGSTGFGRTCTPQASSMRLRP